MGRCEWGGVNGACVYPHIDAECGCGAGWGVDEHGGERCAEPTGAGAVEDESAGGTQPSLRGGAEGGVRSSLQGEDRHG
jgi:hypothetical protein